MKLRTTLVPMKQRDQIRAFNDLYGFTKESFSIPDALDSMSVTEYRQFAKQLLDFSEKYGKLIEKDLREESIKSVLQKAADNFDWNNPLLSFVKECV